MDRNTILFNNSDKKKEQTTQEILTKVYQALDEEIDKMFFGEEKK